MVDFDSTPADVRRSAADLCTAVTAHAERVGAERNKGRVDVIVDAGEVLLDALREYATAVFDCTGSFHPLNRFVEWADEPWRDDPDADETGPTDRITVLLRHDYLVRDVAAVIRAGQAAWMEQIGEPGDGVDHLGYAICAFAHLHGWHSVESMPGLESGGSLAHVIRPVEGGDGESDGDRGPFAVAGTVLVESING